MTKSVDLADQQLIVVGLGHSACSMAKAARRRLPGSCLLAKKTPVASGLLSVIGFIVAAKSSVDARPLARPIDHL
ncbi:hypothetical protein [Pseudomonas paeninsulae]|uniref:hypothetical protein n=1 Tax=Pseudomonas paeninsulae TaxID=3110772 RepID=UPI00389A756E